MLVKNNTFGVAQQTPFALHKRNNANSIYYSFFCPETKEPKILHSKRGDGSTPTTAKTTISASLR